MQIYVFSHRWGLITKWMTALLCKLNGTYLSPGLPTHNVTVALK